ncbi:MAG: hypothetical protein WCV71_04625 [Patescibacteria group bacterium]
MEKRPLQKKGVITVFHHLCFVHCQEGSSMSRKQAAISKVAKVLKKMPRPERSSSKRPISAKVITIRQAREFGLSRFFKTGEVEGIILHNKSEVSVRDFFHIEKEQVVVKNAKGKRQPVPISSMRAFRISDQLAERTAIEAARKVALEAAKKKAEDRANRRKAAEAVKTMI